MCQELANDIGMPKILSRFLNMDIDQGINP